MCQAIWWNITNVLSIQLLTLKLWSKTSATIKHTDFYFIFILAMKVRFFFWNESRQISANFSFLSIPNSTGTYFSNWVLFPSSCLCQAFAKKLMSMISCFSFCLSFSPFCSFPVVYKHVQTPHHWTPLSDSHLESSQFFLLRLREILSPPTHPHYKWFTYKHLYWSCTDFLTALSPGPTQVVILDVYVFGMVDPLLYIVFFPNSVTCSTMWPVPGSWSVSL